MKGKKILVYGYGNPGRQDDGLGVALAEEIDKWAKKNQLHWIDTDTNYQLNIEDATAIKDMDIVFFADASMEENVKDCLLTEIKPSKKTEFTMHAVSPAFIVHLCNKLFKSYPKPYLIHIKGYEWELKEGLTKKGSNNLTSALKIIKEKILSA